MTELAADIIPCEAKSQDLFAGKRHRVSQRPRFAHARRSEKETGTLECEVVPSKYHHTIRSNLPDKQHLYSTNDSNENNGWQSTLMKKNRLRNC